MGFGHKNRQPVWPDGLAEFDPADWPDVLAWHWARRAAGPDLGFELLPLIQAVSKATTCKLCNPAGVPRAGVCGAHD